MVTQELGREGEAVAKSYLEKNGYEIITTNWRHGHLELDIIAHKNKVLHIVEVKTQRQSTAGLPEESVTRAKFLNLQRAAEAFMAQYPGWTLLQFDIVSVTIKHNGSSEILLIEDIYY